jgi:hypothetical protein
MQLVLLALGVQQMWYSAPLIVAVSLVYAGTRHEYLGPILAHAVRFAMWICVFMAVVMAVLTLLNWLVG